MQLLKLLPSFYALGDETRAVQDALGIELDKVQTAREDCFLQLDVHTATWGLALWEAAYGIVSEAGKSLEHRRTRLLAKMRGAGTTTAALIQNVAESFSNGAVEVEDLPDENRFVVRFIGTLGMPPNFEDLKAAIEESKPAHLVVEYQMVFRTHDQLKGYTHEALKRNTHETIRGGTMN